MRSHSVSRTRLTIICAVTTLVVGVLSWPVGSYFARSSHHRPNPTLVVDPAVSEDGRTLVNHREFTARENAAIAQWAQEGNAVPIGSNSRSASSTEQALPPTRALAASGEADQPLTNSASHNWRPVTEGTRVPGPSVTTSQATVPTTDSQWPFHDDSAAWLAALGQLRASIVALESQARSTTATVVVGPRAAPSIVGPQSFDSQAIRLDRELRSIEEPWFNDELLEPEHQHQTPRWEIKRP